MSEKNVANRFLTNVPILYPWFSGVFKGYKLGTLAKNGLLPLAMHRKFHDDIHHMFKILEEAFITIFKSSHSEV